MWHWHAARYPRDNPGRVSAGNDSVERMTGSFLNPQNFAITIGKPIMSWLRQDGQQVDNAVFLLDLAYALVYSVPI